MPTPPSSKQQLLQHWLDAHAPGNSAALFASRAPDFTLTAEAVMLLQRPKATLAMSLYIVYLGIPCAPTIPVYVGKAANLWQRWNTGHLRGIRQAHRTQTGRYTRWWTLFDLYPEQIHLICLHETDILFAPLPDFPTGVGAVEYQLIALAADAYPDTCLNSEGVAR